MSIASEITRLQNAKTAIRNALVAKGISAASSHNMADFATDISSIVSGSVTPGSLIIVFCSKNITAVSAVVNNTTYQGYLDTSTYWGYITIPYTVTSGTVTVNGYSGSTIVATDTVALSGINKYAVAVLSSGVLYNAGTWNVRDETWLARSNGINLRASASTSYLILTGSAGTGTGFSVTRYPVVIPASGTSLKVTLTLKGTPTLYVGLAVGNVLGDMAISDMVALIVGENTYSIPSSLKGKEVYIWFGTDNCTSTTTNRVTKIEIS